MSLSDPFFTKFDGSPDAGRVPTRLIVLGSTGLSESQLRGVDHVYGQFRNACKLSASDFHTEQVKLQDGTIVHMWSLQGRDEVTVTPGDAADEDRLPHGFAVVTNWQSATIYKRVISGPVGPTYPYWEFAGDYVPQVEAGKTIFDNQAFRVADPMAAEKDYFNLPMVYNRNDAVLWDYALRGAIASSTGKTTPLIVKNNTSGDFAFVDPHYAIENQIKDVGGTALYTMADADIILGPSALDYPESVHYLPSATDAEGNQIAMNAWRYAVLSPTANIWKFRLWNERLRRTGDSAYEAIERNTMDFITPWGKQTVTTTNVVDGNLGENPELMFLFRWTDTLWSATAGYISDAPVPTTYHWTNGWTGTEDWQDITGINCSSTGMAAQRIIKEQTDATATIVKVLAAPINNETSYIDIESRLNYPANVFWRSGEQMKGYTKNDLNDFWLGPIGYDPFTSPNYRVERVKLYRKDTVYDVDGSPSVTAVLGWKDLNLLEGTTTGRMSGKEYDNELTRSGSYGLDGYDFILKMNAPGGTAIWAFMVANDSKPEYMADRAAHWTGNYGGPNDTTLWEHPFNIRPSNTVDYNLVSRYVIDYDHKGRFYAAIRCEVTCSGAEWEENRAIYDGFMQVKTDPTYTVKIWFESDWNGVFAEQLLAQETASRPIFEAIEKPMFSPWYWMGYAHPDRDCKARTPPEPVPDENFMFQLPILASNQGVNTNLCCADVRPDIIGDEVVKTQSEEGIEYSYLQDGQVIPHTKYVTGQLYARTFTLASLYESMWMLYQLRVNAQFEGFQPLDGPERPLWYYHPGLKAALDVVRHIEVRDGIIVQWSDNLPGETSGYPPTPAAPPAATGREINLYRV